MKQDGLFLINKIRDPIGFKDFFDIIGIIRRCSRYNGKIAVTVIFFPYHPADRRCRKF